MVSVITGGRWLYRLALDGSVLLTSGYQVSIFDDLSIGGARGRLAATGWSWSVLTVTTCEARLESGEGGGTPALPGLSVSRPAAIHGSFFEGVSVLCAS